ncbi:YveK family protein [Lapidilactobacillus bayanensis]|uniref:YveK family protein n=1 Tax=Lapidilactobacillus bayanensis TaxID=2485998 RepID=UPI0013DDE3D6|nr:Wzz/FepE/Etk N-terminal domain-containing protein [Lapidilactobacillus bayanensis]
MKNRSMNVDDMMSAFRKNIWLIICLTVIGGLLGVFAVHRVLQPTYSSTSRLMVIQTEKNSSKQATTTQFVDLITTYKDMVTDPSIVRPVLKEIKSTQSYDGSLATLTRSISTQSTANSQIFSITVTDTSARRAAVTANKLTAVFQERASAMIPGVKTEVLSKASPAPSTSSPKRWITVLAGMLVGLLIGVLIALMRAPVERDTSQSSTK